MAREAYVIWKTNKQKASIAALAPFMSVVNKTFVLLLYLCGYSVTN